MLLHLNKYVKSHKLLVITSIVLFIIPFFWFPFGYIDIGGDSSRLYFYDPLSFLHNFVLNPFFPDSIGVKNGGIYLLPFVSALALFKLLLGSYYVLNNIFNGITIFLSFIGIFLVVSEILLHETSHKKNKEIIYFSAVTAGFFYVLIPISSRAGWDLPLILHTQRFVYPLVFWLLLRYIHTSKKVFLFTFVLISILFAQNFSWVALPNSLSFFSISIIFLIIYSYLKKTKFSIRPILFTFILFLLVHAFQYFPVIADIFQKNSALNNQLSQGKLYSDTINYVGAIANYTERGYHFIGLSPFLPISKVNAALLIFPLFILITLIRNKNKLFLLIFTFFLVLYFIITGKITNTGFYIFKNIFSFPGFVMFRNFYGKWEHVYLFFFALLVGQSFFNTFLYTPKKIRLFIFYLLVLILIINALPFIKGEVSNRILTQDTGVVVKSRIRPDPLFEQVLDYYKLKKSIGRNLSFPIVDFGYQIVAGKSNDGAYFGPSIIANLTGVEDLSSSFALRPFTQGLYNAAKNKDYKTLSNIFPILNIDTVFYNSDPYVYDVFATFPYNESRLYMPKSQAEYKEFIKNLQLSNIKDIGAKYHIYSVNKSLQLPRIYIAEKVLPLDISSSESNFIQDNFGTAEYVLKNFSGDLNDKSLRKVFLHEKVEISSQLPSLNFSQINPGKYIISVKNALGPYVLVFSQSKNSNWKLFLYEKNIEKKPLAESKHYTANAYANAWLISPTDVEGEKDYDMILELIDQNVINIGLLVSAAGLIVLLISIGKEIL